MTNTTLTSPPVAPLLTRLFEEAEKSDVAMRQLFGSMTPEERTRRMSDPNSDYRGFYHRAKDSYLAVSAETGKLLYLLARTTKAKAIVEFGTSFGISTIHLAAALKDNGEGRLIGTELEPNKLVQARANLTAAGLADFVEIREGDALETLAHDLPGSIDLVLFDGHKPLYPKVLELLESRLHAGSCLVADNANASPPYLARVRAAGGSYLSIPFAEDVELSMKL